MLSVASPCPSANHPPFHVLNDLQRCARSPPPATPMRRQRCRRPLASVTWTPWALPLLPLVRSCPSFLVRVDSPPISLPPLLHSSEASASGPFPRPRSSASVTWATTSLLHDQQISSQPCDRRPPSRACSESGGLSVVLAHLALLRGTRPGPKTALSFRQLLIISFLSQHFAQSLPRAPPPEPSRSTPSRRSIRSSSPTVHPLRTAVFPGWPLASCSRGLRPSRPALSDRFLPLGRRRLHARPQPVHSRRLGRQEAAAGACADEACCRSLGEGGGRSSQEAQGCQGPACEGEGFARTFRISQLTVIVILELSVC